MSHTLWLPDTLFKSILHPSMVDEEATVLFPTVFMNVSIPHLPKHPWISCNTLSLKEDFPLTTRCTCAYIHIQIIQSSTQKAINCKQFWKVALYNLWGFKNVYKNHIMDTYYFSIISFITLKLLKYKTVMCAYKSVYLKDGWIQELVVLFILKEPNLVAQACDPQLSKNAGQTHSAIQDLPSLESEFKSSRVYLIRFCLKFKERGETFLIFFIS